MAHKVVYLVKTYNISTCLVINKDQIGVHLVPIGGDRTWKTKIIKQIQVLGIENKRQITSVISFVANGTLLP
jgi:hypothetical protein